MTYIIFSFISCVHIQKPKFTSKSIPLYLAHPPYSFQRLKFNNLIFCVSKILAAKEIISILREGRCFSILAWEFNSITVNFLTHTFLPSEFFFFNFLCRRSCRSRKDVNYKSLSFSI